MALVCALSVLLLGVGELGAHQTARSFHRAVVEPSRGVVVHTVEVPRRDLLDYLEYEEPSAEFRQRVRDLLRRRIAVESGSKRCRNEEVELREPSDGVRYRSEMRSVCEGPIEQMTLYNSVMTNDPAGYQHFARIELPGRVETTVFDRQFGSKVLQVGAASRGAEATEGAREETASIGRFIWLGVVHILLGFDHILFVLGLLLAARRWRRLLFVISSFTLAHSITLALGALDVVSLAASIVEPIIAASIGLLAVENLYRHMRDEETPAPWHIGAAAGFGLIHGFGFAYILREELQLAGSSVVGPLLGFNLGVELGQLALVAVVFPLLHLLRTRVEELSVRVHIVLDVVLLVAAGVWFVERVVG